MIPAPVDLPMSVTDRPADAGMAVWVVVPDHSASLLGPHLITDAFSTDGSKAKK